MDAATDVSLAPSTPGCCGRGDASPPLFDGSAVGGVSPAASGGAFAGVAVQDDFLESQIGSANVFFGFREDVVAAERTLSCYALLESPTETAQILDELAGELGEAP